MVYVCQVKYGSLQYVTPELQNLYKYLEQEFHPLQLYPAVQPIVQFIEGNEDLAMYKPHMEEIIITRVLKQVSTAAGRKKIVQENRVEIRSARKWIW